MIDDNGVPKGKSYTYVCDFDVAVGDMVMAEFGKSERMLTVVRNDVLESELDFDIEKLKSVSRPATEDDSVEPSGIEFKVISEVPAKIEFNFDQIKEKVSSYLENYKNLVITEKTLPTIKAQSKDLAGLRIKVDTYRKEKKKEMLKPIDAFEDKCKELVSLITDAETPLKEGIAAFDDKEKQEKRKLAEAIIAETIVKFGINEKYAPKLEVQDKYMNKTVTPKEITYDCEARAELILSEQKKEEELYSIISDTVEEENKRLQKKMEVSSFAKLIETLPAREVIAEVKKFANMIYEAEHPVPKEPVKITITEEEMGNFVESEFDNKEPEPMPYFSGIETVMKVDDPEYFGVYRVQGKLSVLQAFSKYLKDNNISFKIESEGTL